MREITSFYVFGEQLDRAIRKEREKHSEELQALEQKFKDNFKMVSSSISSSFRTKAHFLFEPNSDSLLIFMDIRHWQGKPGKSVHL